MASGCSKLHQETPTMALNCNDFLILFLNRNVAMDAHGQLVCTACEVWFALKCSYMCWSKSQTVNCLTKPFVTQSSLFCNKYIIQSHTLSGACDARQTHHGGDFHLSSHDSPDWLHNGPLLHCTSGHSWQKGCVQEVVARGH